MVLADGTTVVDEYDPNLGILLGQDLDFHFDRFEISIYVTVLLFDVDFLISRKQCKIACFSHFIVLRIDPLPSFGMECKR